MLCVLLTVQNFLLNSLHLRNAALISKVWEAVSAEMQSAVWYKSWFALSICLHSHDSIKALAYKCMYS